MSDQMNLFNEEEKETLVIGSLSESELVDHIKKNSELYYEKGLPNVTDQVFDKMVYRLKEINPEHPILKAVGYFGEQGAEPHLYGPVGSLDKETDWKRLMQSYPPNAIVTPKMDGGSLTLYYSEGLLQKIVSRGNGVSGKSRPILHKLVPNEIPYKQPIAIRGEICMKKQVFLDKYKNHESGTKYKSPRNMANGLMGRKKLTIDQLNDIQIITYKIHGSQHLSKDVTKSEVLQLLEDWGFMVVPHTILGDESWQNNFETPSQYFEDWIDNMEYPIDGLVITQENIIRPTHIIMDLPGFFMYTEIAFKFEDDKTNGTVSHVEWQFSDRNNMIPVVKLKDSVLLDGADISSITGFNAKYVMENNIGPDSVVEVKRKNEVIPYISAVLKSTSLELPTNCTYCQTKLEWNGVHLSCLNPDCDHLKERKLFAYIQSFVDDYAIKGIGEKMIQKIIEIYDIRSMRDLIRIIHKTPKHWLEEELNKTPGFGESKIKLVLGLIDKFRSEPVNKAKILSIMVNGLGGIGSSRILETAPDLDKNKIDKIPRLSTKVKELIELKKDDLLETIRIMNSLN